MKLNPRLSLIASYVKKGSAAADIGTDHGYLPVYLAENDICRNIIATDINEGPLNNAIETAKNAGVFDKISFFLTDGLSGVPADSADTVIIAGMGGETMEGILKGAPWLKNENTHLILQPQSKIEELVSWLLREKFYIFDAELVREYGRIYLVIQAGYGKNDGQDSDILDILFRKEDPLLKEALDREIMKNEKILVNLQASSNTETEIKNTENKLNKLKEMRGEI